MNSMAQNGGSTPKPKPSPVIGPAPRDRLDRLELFGVTVPDSVRGYPLSTAYISLAVNSDTLRGDAGFARPDDGRAGQVAAGTLRIDDDALANTYRLFLRNEAGSRKTTLLQWLAVRAARRDFPERLATWNDSVLGFKSLHEALDTTTPGGRLVFRVFAALAEFIRELIVEGTADAGHRGRGRRRGRVGEQVGGRAG